jgi:spore maturation protein CgeB
MSYRFLKIQTTEQVYLNRFFQLYPESKQLSYDKLFETFVKGCCGWNTNYTQYLGALGNESHEICINFEFLQKLWAREHGVKYNSQNWLREIVAAQLNEFKPDVVFLDDLYFCDAGVRQFLRESCPNRVKIVGWRAAPTEDYSAFRDIDLMLTCTPLFVQQMRDHGANVEMVLHAFEPAILGLIDPQQRRDIDFSFMGHFVLKDGFHNDRLALVQHLFAATNLQVWGLINEPQKISMKRRVAAKLGSGISKVIDVMQLPDTASSAFSALHKPPPGPVAKSIERDFPGRFHDPVIALEYFKILSRSRIALNNHIDCAGEFAGNIRLFEATGMQSCLMTDWKINLPEMFEPDAEIVTYRTPEECAEKVRYLLDHEEERQNIAAAGQRRTLRDHTYQRRAEQVDEIFSKLLVDGYNAPSYSLPLKQMAN